MPSQADEHALASWLKAHAADLELLTSLFDELTSAPARRWVWRPLERPLLPAELALAERLAASLGRPMRALVPIPPSSWAPDIRALTLRLEGNPLARDPLARTPLAALYELWLGVAERPDVLEPWIDAPERAAERAALPPPAAATGRFAWLLLFVEGVFATLPLWRVLSAFGPILRSRLRDEEPALVALVHVTADAWRHDEAAARTALLQQRVRASTPCPEELVDAVRNALVEPEVVLGCVDVLSDLHTLERLASEVGADPGALARIAGVWADGQLDELLLRPPPRQEFEQVAHLLGSRASALLRRLYELQGRPLAPLLCAPEATATAPLPTLRINETEREVNALYEPEWDRQDVLELAGDDGWRPVLHHVTWHTDLDAEGRSYKSSEPPLEGWLCVDEAEGRLYVEDGKGALYVSNDGARTWTTVSTAERLQLAERRAGALVMVPIPRVAGPTEGFVWPERGER